MKETKFDRPVTSLIVKESSNFPNQKLKDVITTGSIDDFLCTNSSRLNCERLQTVGLEVFMGHVQGT